jgi:cytochrome b subunit of formate dehydrogenase
VCSHWCCVIAGKRWALLGLKILAPIALLYLVAYSIFGGERALWIAIGVFALTVVVGMSVYYAYRPRI